MINENMEIFDKYTGATFLDYFDEKVVDINAGKMHSLFLTESGKLYSLGYNSYGQLGLSNALYAHTETPVEVFLPEGVKVKQMSTGNHHTLVLGENGKVYGFGAKLHG